MVYKDQEKRREYHRQWKKEHPGYNRKWWRSWKKKKDPNYKPRITFHDYETHRELAMASGIKTQPEWVECYKLGFMPDGIYFSPDREFRENKDKKVHQQKEYNNKNRKKINEYMKKHYHKNKTKTGENRDAT